MGWFGIGSDEKDELTWEEEFKKILDSVPHNERITIVDCHI